MSNHDSKPGRPARFEEAPLPPIPDVSGKSSDVASVEYSHHRTELSTHRTGLSEHRTSLSEYRTDLSGNRTEMSMRRTGMSFQRTRMSADRTLMSIIRTSLSLISFGFTIYQVFQNLQDAKMLAGGRQPHNFGIALVVLGLLLLTMGIVYHVRFMVELRTQRAHMRGDSLIHGESQYPVSATLITASLLWLLGLLAVANMALGWPSLG